MTKINTTINAKSSSVGSIMQLVYTKNILYEKNKLSGIIM
ncbi:hypothetical protein E24_00342 [Faustovirus]|nr:hypothetical protein E24_00342 [Faustovirus]AMN84243.1 hypothetical protein D5a_00340 [Faustovirus]AMN85231.1 hypothetical protein E23_00342 [Faustovirus]